MVKQRCMVIVVGNGRFERSGWRAHRCWENDVHKAFNADDGCEDFT